MAPNPTKIFVSYSHDSPRHSDRVRALADRLCGDGVDATIDQYDPHPSEPWPRWMDRQIDEADFVLVVCTETYLRRAQGNETPGTGHGVTFESVRIVQDLYDAGMWNEKVIPVLFDGASSRFIPKPLRGYSHYRVDTDAGYEDLLRHLLNQPRVRKPAIGEPRSLPPIPGRSSFRSMVPDHAGFIHRKEYDQVVEALCAENPHGSTVGITTALRGAGGFGKTALAQAVCQDERVQEKYPDGILLTTMGEEVSESGRLSRLRDLIRWWTESDPPVFERVDTASAFLRELLANRRVLLVVDDVWSELDLIPFQGMSSALLITTREKDVLPSGSQRIDVDAMEIPEAVNLLRVGLPEWDVAHFNSLARRLGEWPLLLTLVNRQLRELVEKDGFSVGEALQEVESILESEGLTGFDRQNAESRQFAVEKTLAVSLKHLNDPELACRYRDLAVFPDDVEIPVSIVERFWGSSRGETEKLCRRLDNLSLLLRFDRRKGIVQLHDVVRHYLVRREGENLPNLHRRFLDTFRPQSGHWKDLPETESYLWRYLGYHLLEAGERDVLRDLLIDFSFLWSKLQAADVNALVADYEPFARDDEELRLVQGALRLSAHILARDENQIAPHLLGRLLSSEASGIRSLLEHTKSWNAPLWLRPRFPTFVPPGGSLLRTLEGHTDWVNAVAVMDGRRAISASSDRTLRVWDLETGKNLKILEGHTKGIHAVAVIEGHRAISASNDWTLRVWDLKTGQTLKVLEGHTAGVSAVAVVDGHHAISASYDRTLRLWDLEIGQTLKTLEGRFDGVSAVAVLEGRFAVSTSYDGTLRAWNLETGKILKTLEERRTPLGSVVVVGSCAVSASYDGMLRVMDLETGQTLKTLAGYSDGVRTVVVDGHRAVSASEDDGALRVWDLETGQTLKTLEGHTDGVRALAVLDGSYIVSASFDGTLRVWDLETVQTLKTLEGHSSEVRAVAIVDGHRALSASYDGTLRLWDLETGQTLKTLKGHTSWVRAVAVVENGRAVSASDDRTLRVWDLETGQILKTLEGHTDGVRAVAMLEGYCAISASDDRTLRIWDLKTGKTLKTLEGHTDGVKAVTVVDSRRIISASDGGTVRVWDLDTGQVLKGLKGHAIGIRSVAMVDSRRAISASFDGTLRLWDLETGQTLKTLEGHSSEASGVAVVNGRRAVSASYDRTLRVWDLETGECLTVLNLEQGATAVAVTLDGKTVVAGDSSGRVHFLDLVEAAEAQPPKGAAFE